MAWEGEEDQKLDIVTELHRIEGNGEPWLYTLNLPVNVDYDDNDDDDDDDDDDGDGDDDDG